jgi:hypothetical protein
MKFWTVLWITFVGNQWGGESYGIPYESPEACEAATSVVSATLGYEHMMVCEESWVASSSPFPKRRPEGLK